MDVSFALLAAQSIDQTTSVTGKETGKGKRAFSKVDAADGAPRARAARRQVGAELGHEGGGDSAFGALEACSAFVSGGSGEMW